MSSGSVGVDIRLPMGLMFTIMGLIITIYGAMTMGQDIYDKHSLGINVNLWWGLVLTGFGLIMLLLTWLGSRKNKPASGFDVVTKEPTN